MRKLIESTFVTLGGDIGAPQDWGPPYLFTPEVGDYSRELLFVPVTHGPGQPLFTDLPETSLELAGARTFSTGVVLLTYVPATTGRPATEP